MKSRSNKLAIGESAQQLSLQPPKSWWLLPFLWIVFAFNSSLAQNVGIGTDSPTQKLEVVGGIKGTNLLCTGFIGIGTMTPAYKLHVYNGPVALTNTTDNMTWSIGYNSITTGLNFINNSGVRLTLLNSGNIGIGTSTPDYKLDVNGHIHSEANAFIDGSVIANNINAETNAVIGGNLTVNNGKGVLRNSHGSGQLKYYTRTATFTVTNLGGFDLSAEGTIGFTSGIFTSPPKVFVGDIVSTGGTLGELFRVQLIVYEVTTTSCKVRLLNTSPNPVSYSITWNIVCIGE